MGSAFDKLLVLWTLCALTTLLCGVFLGVLYHLLGQQIFVAGALHTLVVSVFVSFRFTALDGTSLAVATNNTLTTWPGPLQRLAYWVYFVTAVLPFYLRYEHRLDTRSALIRDWAVQPSLVRDRSVRGQRSS